MVPRLSAQFASVNEQTTQTDPEKHRKINKQLSIYGPIDESDDDANSLRNCFIELTKRTHKIYS